MTESPALSNEWDWDKNEIDPHTLFGNSKEKVWWKCEDGHSWKSTVFIRVRGSGCPFCYGRLKDDKSNLYSLYPDIASEWDYNSNRENPETIWIYSPKEVNWICKTCGKKWSSSVRMRTEKGISCPHCNHGRRLVEGEYSLYDSYPELMKEWNLEENCSNGLDPRKILPRSQKKASWVCPNGHKYEASIYNRTKSRGVKQSGTGCPECLRLKDTSFPETAFFYYIKKAFPSAEHIKTFEWFGRKA